MPESLLASSFTISRAASLESTPPFSSHVVHWGLGPIRFELRCDDAEFLSRASKVLSPWRAANGARLVRQWRVNRLEDERWEVRAANEPFADYAAVSHGTRRQALGTVEYDAVHKLLEFTEYFSTLHSALLSDENGKGVAIVGPCQAGKTTLSCALWNSGWSLQSDDMTFFHADGSAYPSRRRVSLRRESRELIGEELWWRAASTPSCEEMQSGLLFHPHEAYDRIKMNETQLTAIVFLARRNVETEPAQLKQINSAQAAMALLPYSNVAERLPFPQALARVAALTEQVPVYDLGRGPLPQMIASVDSLMS